LVDQRQFDEDAGIVERAGRFRSANVSGLSALIFVGEEAGFAVIAPVLGRLLVRRVDDELVYGRAPGWAVVLIFVRGFGGSRLQPRRKSRVKAFRRG
jgi:hypothetical protein